MRRLALALLVGCATVEPPATQLAPVIEALAARTVATCAPQHSAGATRWTLDALVAVALRCHPSLDVARAHEAELLAAVTSADVGPNPTLSVAGQSAINPDPGQVPWALGLDVDIPIETAGKRAYRSAEAAAQHRVGTLAVAEAGWAVRRRVRETFVALGLAQRRVAAIEAERVQREAVAALARARLDAGETDAAPLRVARLDLLRTQVDEAALRGEVRVRMAELAASVGLGVSALGVLALDDVWIDAATARAAPLESTRALADRLDLHRALEQVAAAEAAQSVARAAKRPDVHLAPSYTYDQGQHKLGLGVSVALPVADDGEGPVAEAAARVQAAKATLDELSAAALADQAAAVAAWSAAASSLALFDDLQHAQDEALHAAERHMAGGAGDRGALEDERLVARVTARLRVDALAQLLGAMGAYEDALQRPLAPGGH